MLIGGKEYQIGTHVRIISRKEEGGLTANE